MIQKQYLFEKLISYFRLLGPVHFPKELLDPLTDEVLDEINKDLDEALRFHHLGRKILENVKTELFLSFKFFGLSLSYFIEASGDAIFLQLTETISTNGQYIYFKPSWLINQFKNHPYRLNRIYLHLLFHTLFKHVHLARTLVDIERWNLASDITVEYLIDGIKDQQLSNQKEHKREALYEKFFKMFPVLHVRAVYEALKDKKFNKLAVETKEIWTVDDHSLWYKGSNEQKPSSNNHQSKGQSSKQRTKEDNKNDESKVSSLVSEELQKLIDEAIIDALEDANPDLENSEEIDEITSRLEIDLQSFNKNKGSEPNQFLRSLHIRNRKRYNYRDFLRRFMTRREILKESLDEFDYIYYTLGLSNYQNMPLFEPLEYSQGLVLETFVIAIDTSGSTFDDVVEIFLEETCQILKQADIGTRRVQIYLIQCDAEIAEEVVFTSYKAFEVYKENFKLMGGGGTDFRPVFDRVETLIKTNVIQNLKGLVYFTDGMGTYPEKRTPYETAFVFYEDNQYNDLEVPSWASKLIIQKEEIV
jgi:predicted metal-dependent peptidase